MNVLGIDPGLSGGLCILNEEGIIDVIKMPLCTRLNRKGNYIDLKSIFDFIAKYNNDIGSNDFIQGIFIERQFILRSQGMSSGSKTMYQSGLLYGLCFAECNDLHEINAKDWQSSIFNKLDTTKINNYNYSSYTKLQSIAFVEQTYGNKYLFKSKRQTKPSDGLADAICIAHFGLEQLIKTITTNKQ
jgi:crossover junction endodeoxyribonuclease RuvC